MNDTTGTESQESQPEIPTVAPEKMAAVAAILFWQMNTHASNFNALLLALIHKADPLNREKLRLGFPEFVVAWEEWQATPDPDDFFRRYGLKKVNNSNGKVADEPVQN